MALGNVDLDYDLWQGLRNPAVMGLYPVGLQDIWEFYAHSRKESVDQGGRGTIIQVPRSFDHAHEQYARAVIISMMLPFANHTTREYAQTLLEQGRASPYRVNRILQDINLLIDKSTSRVGMELVSGDTVVVAMDTATVRRVSTEGVPITRQAASHGPSKPVNYPQKSIAALTGLWQFGIARFIFRDEVIDGRIQRFVGLCWPKMHIRSKTRRSE